MDLNNKSVLITGGTGSLGKELTKTILQKYPNIKYCTYSNIFLLNYGHFVLSTNNRI